MPHDQTEHRKLAAIVFTDIVGSTQLKNELREREAVALIRRHHVLIRETLAGFHEGEEIETAGDSFLILFAKPSDAVKFALLVQSKMRVLGNEGHPISDRIGIHVGEVLIDRLSGSDKTKALSGIHLDTCARIMSLGQGHQILMTRFAFDSARSVLKGEDIEGVGPLCWANHGPYILKGVEEPLEICEVGEAGTAPLKPPSSSEKAQRYVAEGSEPVLGWRPALEQVVPNTRWVLEKKLGEGGFGEVWLGRHETLKERRVFKFCFRADRVRSLKREVTLFRLLKERVGHHPNIVGIQEVFFDEPPFYIVMDYAEGLDLQAWSEERGSVESVPLATRLEIVAQVADALQAAHEAGVIHRDVKPSNILVSGQGAGIGSQESGVGVQKMEAKTQRSGESSSSSTNPKSEIRNPKLEVKLTDFGIGQVVSAEALAGMTRMGFTQTMLSPGSSSQTGTHLYMAPELLAGKPASTRSDIYSLGVVLYQLLIGDFSRPLTTDWAKRITDPLLRADLEKCFAGNPEERFQNASQLSQNLRTLKQRHAELSEQQAALAAKQKAAGRRRATRMGALVSVLVVAMIFFGKYVLRQSIRKQGTTNAEARDLYMKGRESFERWSVRDTRRARDYFEKAIEKDPNYADAYAMLAITYLHGPVGLLPQEAVPKGREYVKKAVEIDTARGEVHLAVAQLRFAGDWDWQGADAEFQRAIKLDSTYPETHHMYSHFLMAMGRTNESLFHSRQYVKLDTVGSSPPNHLGWHYLMTRQYEEAIKQELNAIEKDSHMAPAHLYLGQAYVLGGHYEQGIGVLKKGLQLSGEDKLYKAWLGFAYAAAGRQGEAQEVVKDLKQSNLIDAVPYPVAAIYAALGDNEQAFQWLRKAYQARAMEGLGMTVYLKVDPAFDNVRADPRFTALLKEMGLDK